MTIEELTPAQIQFLSGLIGENNELAGVFALLNGDPSNIQLLNSVQKNMLQNQLNVVSTNRPDFPKAAFVMPPGPQGVPPPKGIHPLVLVGAAAAIYWFFFRKKSSEGGA